MRPTHHPLDLLKRTVQCVRCRWLMRIPSSVDEDQARTLAVELARLHLANEHRDAEQCDFELSDFGPRHRVVLAREPLQPAPHRH